MRKHLDGSSAGRMAAQRRVSRPVRFGAAFFLISILFSCFLQKIDINVVRGGSMETTLSDGDVLLASRQSAVSRGDIVTISDKTFPGRVLIKRIAALPGDIVYITADESVFVNEPPDTKTAECIPLGPDEYFVLGDAENSYDSRSFGAVERSAIRDVVFCRIVPFSFL